ncbi:flagellar hook-length control protein FliK [Mangrovibacter plantisponsor]|uniref:Flagellar hook-length control protein FliK n=1 Tax=Mangrovibacter plantisponsor TaxID=451513 RepID=A0A317PJY4_9ENTR|nr:flagellar hook-length control protein FliK [Mangrovibacter plantisponsor]PWW00808.1 flagellar hook-length control protein FliK [Mangrovibacter plantisponsor]
MAWISVPEQGQHWQDNPSLPENSLLAHPGTLACGTAQVPETFSHLLFSMERAFSPAVTESVPGAPVCLPQPLTGISLSDDITVLQEATRLPGALPPASTAVQPVPLAAFMPSTPVPSTPGVLSAATGDVPAGLTERVAPLAAAATLPATPQEIARAEPGQQPVTPVDTRQAAHQPQVMATVATMAATMADAGRDNASVAGQHPASGTPVPPLIAVASPPEPPTTDASQRLAAATPAHQPTAAHSSHPQTERLQAALGARLQMHIANRTQTAHIRLDPPALGKIDIHLHLEQGQLQVALHTQHEDVARALRLVSHGLQEQLAADTTQRVSVQVSTGQGQSPRQPQGEGSGLAPEEHTPTAGMHTRAGSETRQDATILLTI